MSREIAQTVTGKKFGLLVALLALIAVSSALASNWRQAQAVVPTANVVFSQTTSTTPGAAVSYTADATFAPDGTSAVTPNATMIVDFDDDLVFVGTNVATAWALTGGTCVNGAGNVVTCTWTGGNYTSTPDLVFNFTNPVTGALVSAPTVTQCLDDADAGPPATCNTTALVAYTPTPAVTGGATTTVFGGTSTVTFIIAPGFTYCADPNGITPGAARIFTATDQVVTGLSVQSTTPTTALNSTAGTHTVVVFDDATPGGTVQLFVRPVGTAPPTPPGSNGVPCTPFTVTLTAANFVVAELRHIDPITLLPLTDQDINNNVRGARHTICTFAANTVVGPDGTRVPFPPAVPVVIPLNSLTQINVVNGGGYQRVGDVFPSFTDPRIFTAPAGNTVVFGDQGPTAAGGGPATCFSWTSTAAGDQEISVLYQSAGGLPVTVDWDSDANGNVYAGSGTSRPVLGNRSIIKEWNVLEDSCVIAGAGRLETDLTPGLVAGCSATATVASPTVQINANATFDASNSTYRITAINVFDGFRGSHITRAGSLFRGFLQGVNVTVTVETGCGAVVVPPGPFTVLTANGFTTITGPAGLIGFQVISDAACQFNDRIVIRIVGTEPGPLGSGVGRTVVQYVVINLVSVLPTKQVFLAWAGQRIILEHDWRIAQGDHDVDNDGNGNPVPDGICPFGDNNANALNLEPTNTGAPFDDDIGSFLVQYIKGGGPGNFLNSFAAVIIGSDEADVSVGIQEEQTDDEVPGNDPYDPNRNCISRVLFESEDMGQVDIEAFVYGVSPVNPDDPSGFGDPRFLANFTPLADNQTKIAFVIYYLKLEDVRLSLVTSVSKPTHNAPFQGVNGDGYATSGLNDYSPGNPWDTSTDVTTADWNVSRDLLVRGRVRGWVTTSNPSGRAVGTDTNGGLLPAGRWVFPDDWALMAGGPADPANGSDARGIAENFRPEFDIMIAPNNTAGFALDTPEYAAVYFPITTLVAPVTFTSGSITVRGLAPADVRSAPFQAAAPTLVRINNEDLLVTGPTLVVGTANCGGDFQCFRYTIVGRGQFGTTIAEHAVGALVRLFSNRGNGVVSLPFEGPYSLLDITNFTSPTRVATFSGLGFSAALSNLQLPQAAPCFTPITIVASACQEHDNVRDTVWSDGDVDMWDAPLPFTHMTIDIRGSGFIKRVYKHDVYYIGSANSAGGGAGQVYPNPFYIANIPDSPFIPAVVAGGGYLWDSWGADGPANPVDLGMGVYRFWQSVRTPCQGSSLCVGSNIFNITDTSITNAESVELAQIRAVYQTAFPAAGIFTTLEQPMTSADVTLIVTNGTLLRIGDLIKIDQEYMAVTGINGNLVSVIRNQSFGAIPALAVPQAHAAGSTIVVVGNPAFPTPLSNNEGSTIARTLVVYSDNHGEFMVTANGDFKLDYAGCATNALGGGKHCKPGDKVGASTIVAVADYPDFRGKHYPLGSNTVTVNWTWGGYKDVTIEAGETDQFAYVVFHALDRDAFCSADTFNAGAFFGVSLHPVLTDLDRDVAARAAQAGIIGSSVGVGAGARIETVDFLVDSGDGRILTSNAGTGGGVLLVNAGTGILGVPTFSTYANDPAITGIREFPLSDLARTGQLDECQAWVKVSNSLLGITDILVIAHDDEGDIGFDAIIDFTNSTTYTLTFRWSLVTWAGADNISPTDALKGTGSNAGGTNIYDKVTAIYGWNQASQAWLGFFPNGVGVPGANDLTALKTGQAYWIAITGPDPVTWTVVSNVS